MANSIEELARQMLNAAWERRTTTWDVPDVVAPRDSDVVQAIGRDFARDADELWRAEQFMYNQHYIVRAPIASGGRSVEGFYTITSEGHAFRRGALS